MHQPISASSTPKGKAPLRPCPDDFRVIFVEKGREACMAWYRARRETVSRWLTETGKAGLIAERAAYVASMRAQGNWITRQTAMVAVRKAKAVRVHPIKDKRKVSYTVARHAAQFLRINRNGGWRVSQAQDGNWWIGSKRLSAAQMVDLATAKGFDVGAIRAEDEVVADPAARAGDYATRNELIRRRELAKDGRPCRGGPVRPYKPAAAPE